MYSAHGYLEDYESLSNMASADLFRGGLASRAEPARYTKVEPQYQKVE